MQLLFNYKKLLILINILSIFSFTLVIAYSSLVQILRKYCISKTEYSGIMDPPIRFFDMPPRKISYETLPPDYKSSISRYISVMKYLGIDFFGRKLGLSNIFPTVRLLTHSVLFIPFITLTYGFIFRLDEFENFLHAASVFPSFIINTLDIIKMSAVLIKKNEIKKLMLEIGELWPKQLGHGEKKHVVATWLQRTILITKAFFMYAVGNTFTFFFIPFSLTLYNVLTGVNEYLLPLESPGPWLIDSIPVYLATFLLEMTMIPVHIYLYISYDILIIINTFNIGILFRALQVDLKDAIQAACATRKNMKVLDEDFDKIKKVVMTHQKILSLVDKLNNCFALVVFVHTAISSFLICFFVFMTVAYSDIMRIVSNVFSAIAMSVTVFVIALSGQLLYDTSTGVAEAAYDSVWYESDLKVQRLVVFVIIRSQQPCYLNALNFSTMTLATFSKIISSAWTYLSLLIQMYERR